MTTPSSADSSRSAFSPAVDAVAGEKERGTMETLLLCPATRLEVVLGKFLAAWAFIAITPKKSVFSRVCRR